MSTLPRYAWRRTRALFGLVLAAWLAFANAPAEACTTGGCITAGPRLASVSSTRGVLLNALLGNLLGTSLNVTAVDWNTLATGDVSTAKLLNALQAQLNVSSPTTALTTNATVAQLVAAAAAAATADNKTALAGALSGLQGQLTLLSGTIRLGDLLTTDGGLGDTRIDALELVSGAIQLYNTRNVLSTPAALTISGSSIGLSGLLNQVRLSAQVIEAPVYVCGPSGSSFHTAAIRVELDIDLVSVGLDTSLLTALVGVSSVTLQVAHLGIYVEVAHATGTIGTVDAIAGALTAQATPGIASVYLGLIPDSVFFDRTHALDPTDLQSGVIGSLKVNGTGVSLTAKGVIRGQAPAASGLSFTGPYPQTRTAITQAGFATQLASDLANNLTIGITPSLGLLDAVVLPVLRGVVQLGLVPILGNVLPNLANPLLELLGVRLGEVDVTAGGVYKVCGVSGCVYDDANHTGLREAGEAGTASTLYAKLVPTAQPSGPALVVATVDPTTGLYSLPNVPVGSYTLVVSTAAGTASVAAAGPAGWVATEVPSLSRSLSIAGDLSSQNFGLYHGARVDGTVFYDNGRPSGTPNNGLREAAEKGVVGATLVLTNAAGSTELARATSGDQGTYTIWLPFASAGAVKLAEVPNADRIAIGGSAGNSGGSYTLATASIAFTAATGTSYAGLNFADVPANRFDTDGQQSTQPGSSVFFAHGFVAGSAGQLSFSTSAPSLTGWSAVLYDDANCNGKLDAGEAALTGARAVVAEQRVCLIVKVNVPAAATYDTRYPMVVTAQLAYANHTLIGIQTRGDLTLVGATSDDGLRLIKSVDKGSATIGDTLTYTISYANLGGTRLQTLKIVDRTPAYTVFASAACGTATPGLPTCSVTAQPAAGAAGLIEWTFTGALESGATGTVQLVVTVR